MCVRALFSDWWYDLWLYIENGQKKNSGFAVVSLYRIRSSPAWLFYIILLGKEKTFHFCNVCRPFLSSICGHLLF